MKEYFRRNIFNLIAISIITVLMEVLTTSKLAILLAIGLILICISFFINRAIWRRLLIAVGLFLVILALANARSIWLTLLSVALLFAIFRTNVGNEFIYMDDALVRPQVNADYIGVQLIEAQSKTRLASFRRDINEELTYGKTSYEWDDINLVFIGGNTIVDLGNTILKEGENLVLIRKVFGRTRLIIPKDVGLKLNISAISGRVIFEGDRYELTGENFRWMSPNYQQASRRLKTVISIVFGDVEVIIL